MTAEQQTAIADYVEKVAFEDGKVYVNGGQGVA